MIETGLNARLRAEVAAVSNRVYPTILPHDVTFPAITYQRISDPRLHSADGADRLVAARYQVTTFAQRFDQMKVAANQVRLALDGWSGTMGDHDVARVQHLGGRDAFERDADEEGVHSDQSDYLIIYEEA